MAPKAKAKGEPKAKAKATTAAEPTPESKARAGSSRASATIAAGSGASASKALAKAAAKAKEELPQEDPDKPVEEPGSSQGPKATAATTATAAATATTARTATTTTPPTTVAAAAAAAPEISGGKPAESSPASQTAVEGKAPSQPEAEAEAEAPSQPEPKPEVKLPTVEERAKRLQDEVPDPWAPLSQDAALQKIRAEEWEVCELDSLGDGDKAAAHVLANYVVDRMDSGRTKLASNAALERVAVSLDVQENQILRVDALPALWLRQLLLNANPLESLEGLDVLFPKLLCIDLSFVDFSSLEGVWEALAACPNLCALVAEGSSVSSFEDMVLMPALQSLELHENDVEEIEEIAILAKKCPSLTSLDLRENPVASEGGYAKAVKKYFPRLVSFDDMSQKKSVVGLDKVKFSGLNKDVNAVDGLYRNEHCSCLEGNPCLTQETCVDWKHREVVAAEARKRKGLRDDTGKQL